LKKQISPVLAVVVILVVVVIVALVWNYLTNTASRGGMGRQSLSNNPVAMDTTSAAAKETAKEVGAAMERAEKQRAGPKRERGEASD